MRTTPYHPQGNEQCKSMNQTIVNMLKTLKENRKPSSNDHVIKLVYV